MKKNHHLIICLSMLLAILSVSVYGQKAELKSPNGEIKISIDLKNQLSYSVIYNNDTLLKNCNLFLELENETLGVKPELKGKKASTINEQIKREIPFKNSLINNNCNVLTLNFKNNYSVEFRAFNDGIAYRFVTVKQGEIAVKSENVTVNFTTDNTLDVQLNRSFKTAYENLYQHKKISEYKTTDEMANLPLLVEASKNYKILISEADLYDYPCMFFKSSGSNGLVATFPKVPLEFGEDGDRSQKILKEADYIAKTAGTRSFPWRMFLITKDDKELVGNDMVFKLSSPNKLGDVSWVKPGQVSWEWWHDAALYGVDFVSGYNMDSYKYYIDFASTFGIPYILMDEGWAKTIRNPFIPNGTINLQELIKYGNQKNVKIILWLTWLTVEQNLNTVFKTFSEWGIAGVKIDFMDRSDQWMVNYYERVAKEAAKYKMFVDFHGAFKPAGMECAYPNVLSHEGVLGLEQGGRCKPDNSLYLPFVRNAVGPMDFTPGAMLNGQPENLGYTRIKPVGTGTRCFSMSLYIVFESGLQMLADNPFNYYRERECTDFITKVPVTWDETKALYAEAGKCLIVAKRKGDQWFIGGMVNDSEKVRTIDVDLSFLSDNKNYQVTAFQDGINAGRQAADYKKKEYSVKKGDKISITMVRNGGFAAVLK
jgi:alpha-glucosidase